MSAAAEFYVFVGVMAFLYCIAALVLYIGFDDKYRKFDNVPIIVSFMLNNQYQKSIYNAVKKGRQPSELGGNSNQSGRQFLWTTYH